MPTDAERMRLASWLRCGAPATRARLHAGRADLDAPDGPFIADINLLDPNLTGTLSSDRLGSMAIDNSYAPAYPDTLFHYDRTGSAQIRVPIPGTGHYAVTLLFAENACTTGAPECHIPFDVQIAGQPWLNGFDILAAAGTAHRAVIRSTTVDVANGSQLRIALGMGGKVSAVEVVRTEPCTTDGTCPFGFMCTAGMCAVNPAAADAGTVADGGPGADGSVGIDASIHEGGVDGGLNAIDGHPTDGSGGHPTDGSANGETSGGNHGCHCHVAGTPGHSRGATAIAALVALGLVIRRRRRLAEH
jgi:MYXO-CTERM domain-containing protein